MNYKEWTEEEIELLKELNEKGLFINDMVDFLTIEQKMLLLLDYKK